MSWKLCVATIVAASPVLADAPRLRVSMADGDPLDRIYILNLGSCGAPAGLMTLDMSNSAGGLVIDTQYGGLGSRDPSPITVEMGPIALEPVADGDTGLAIRMGGLGPGELAVISFDGDTRRSFWEERRVVFEASDLVGTRIAFRTRAGTYSTEFGPGGQAFVDLPPETCETGPASPVPQPEAEGAPIG